MKTRRHSGIFALLAIICFALCPRPVSAYSLLTHEQLIDLTWKESIVPLLLSHYPNLTPAELDRARAYAYGGCVIQDIGYYPFGDQSFSNLTHYVRSGDFVVNLFRNAQNANELAFAIGALSHYIGDSFGHAEATNLAVPVEFPKLEAKYGHSVSYARRQAPARSNRICFRHQRDRASSSCPHPVPAPYRTRRIDAPTRAGLLSDLWHHRELSQGADASTFADTVSLFTLSFPALPTASPCCIAATNLPIPRPRNLLSLRKRLLKSGRITTGRHTAARRGSETYLLAGFLFVLPKVGPLTLVSVKGPTQQTEADYAHSVAVSTTALRRILVTFTPEEARYKGPVPPLASIVGSSNITPQPRDPLHPLANRDLDTGRIVQPAGYPLTDSTYASLLHKIVQKPAQPIPPGIKEDIQKYYSNLDLPFATKKDPDRWKQVLADLNTLAGMPTSNAQEPFPTYGDDQSADE